MPERGAVVADALPLMGLGLLDALEWRGYRPVARVGTVDALVRAVRRIAPRMAVVDLSIPGASAAVGTVCRDACSPLVLLVGGPGQDELIVQGVLAGAVGSVRPEITCDALRRAVVAVEEGESVLPRRLVPRVLAELRLRTAHPASEPSSHLSVLTTREHQILEMMRAGLTTAEIAQRLVVEPVTVRTHICAIRRKLYVGGGDLVVPSRRGRRPTLVI